MNRNRLICGIYFVSGISALIFELLWFRQAGLAFGGSVWASSLVLSGFMAGLAVGSFAAARFGHRISDPIRAYIAMELLVAVTGVGLIYFLPALGSVLGPVLLRWTDIPVVINPIRLFLSFCLLLIPSTAMGMTFPLLTRALTLCHLDFGVALAELYGWNTLGAVLGVCLPEILLIDYLGIRGSGLFAASLNVAAAAAAANLIRAPQKQIGRKVDLGPRRTSFQFNHWLAAAFLSGFCLLALEVVWFRFLALYTPPTTAVFALILAIVLGGIGLGGLAASDWLTRDPKVFHQSAPLAFIAGTLSVLGYAGFSWITRPFQGNLIHQPLPIMCVAIPLMFPVSFVSGVFFTFVGAALRGSMDSDMEATGALSMVNTTGAAAGSFIGGFVLLPKLGMERSFFLIACLYGVLGLMVLTFRDVRRPMLVATGGALILALGLFPFGKMQRGYIQVPAARYQLDESNILVATREGLTETILYVRNSWFGKTVAYRMITNVYSMSSTDFSGRRYMKLFVYWPIAVHPHLKKALLISYGVGNTAKALTDTRDIETIDIVDISRDILETNSVIYTNPAGQPLHDPRVRIHIEDGRYFLQSTRDRFDLITGEPPPPTVAGVVNLYTREYFQLMYGRLSEGGIATYWLPMHSLSEESAKSILRSFCDVFADCSLWTGMGSELMMVGTRQAKGPVSIELFTRQWNDPMVREELTLLGFEKPEQFGALFIGDSDYLQSFLSTTPALVDNFPRRILARGSEEGFRSLFRAWSNVSDSQTRFMKSAFIKRLWPDRMRMASLPYFKVQRSLNTYSNAVNRTSDYYIPFLHEILTETTLTTLPVWLMGGNADLIQAVAKGVPFAMDPSARAYLRGLYALSRRNYADAVKPFREAEHLSSLQESAFRYRIYALCMSGQITAAEQLVKQSMPKPDLLAPFWVWMQKTFGIQ